MNIAFHIGYHKTGTSWLQQNYFLHHPDIQLLTAPNKPWDDPFLRYLVATPDRAFDPRHCAELLTKQIQNQTVPGVNKGVFMVSTERLSGHPYSGGYDNFRIAERIAQIAPQAKVLCIVRQQIPMLISVYKQMVSEGYTGTFYELTHGFHWKIPGFELSFYNYDQLLEHYRNLFGTGHVLFLSYEKMRDDPSGFVQQICAFLDIRYIPPQVDSHVNVSLPDRAIPLLRRLNYLRLTELNPTPLLTLPKSWHRGFRAMIVRLLSRLPSRQSLADPQLLERIERSYEHSNQRLHRMSGGEIDYL